MEIDFSGLPDKTQPKTPAIDLSGLPDKEINTSVSSGPQWVQGKEPSLIEKTFSFFKDPEKEKSRATLALVDSEVLGISPSAAYRYRDMIDNGLKINQKAAMLQSTKLQRVGQSIDVGKKTNQKGLIGFEALITGDPKWHEEMNRIKLPTEEERFISESRLENAYRQAAEMAPMMLSSALEATPKALTTAALFSAAAGIFLGPETMPAGWGTGMAVGGGIGAFQAAMKREAGLAYSDIINMKDKEGNPINPQIARAASLGIGVINGAIEVAQIKTLLKSIPGFENLLGKAIVETVKSKVLKEGLADLAFRYGKNITTETLQEVSQESSNIVFEELSKILTNQTKGTQFERAKVEDVFNRLKETASASAQAFAVMFVPGNVAKATAEIAETGKAKEKIKPVIQTSPSVATVTNINRDDTTGEVQSYDLKDNAGNIYDGITPEQVPETIKTIIEETQTEIPDFEDRLDALIQSEDEITEGSISQLLSDEVLGEDMTDVSGVEGKTQQALNEALETEVQPKNSIIDNLSLLNNQKGSIDLEPLVDIGRSVWLEGKQTFEQFYARIKEIAGDMWAKIEPYIKDVWNTINNESGKIAFHGSPHTFDKFSTEKIGTGEGAQAYGYGLYFAGNKEVAEFYKKQLAPRYIKDFSVGSLRFYKDEAALDYSPNERIHGKEAIPRASLMESIFVDEWKILEAAEKGTSVKDAVLSIVNDWLEVYESDPEYKQYGERIKRQIENGTMPVKVKLADPGRLYEVDLAPEEDDYLLWDKPLSEQSEKVKTAISKISLGDDLLLTTQKYAYNTNGSGLIYALEKHFKSDKDASAYLHSLGIRGIKYLDGSSRGKGEGNYNYVIFSDEDVKITAIDNLVSTIKNQKGSIDITPIIELGRFIYNEGATTLESFTTRAKELLGDAWDKVKNLVKQAWDIISSERGSFSTKPKSLYEAVKKAGGLDPEYIKQYHNWKEDIQQYDLLGVTKKGGRSLDDLATELQSQGILDLTPDEYAGPGDYLLSELKKESQRKRGLTIDITDLTDEEKAAIKELETEWHDQGLALQDIEERRRTAYEVFQDQGKENRLTKEALEARIEEKLRQLKSLIPTSKVKSVIRRNTGQVSLADFVREDTALQAAFTKAAQNARIAFREGNKAGIQKQKDIIKELLAKAQQRLAEKEQKERDIETIKRLAEMKGDIAVDYQKKIKELMTGFDFKNITAQKWKELQGLKDYIDREGVPLGIKPKRIAELSRLTDINVKDLTPEQIGGLKEQLKTLTQLGKLKANLKYKYKAREHARILNEIKETTNNLDPVVKQGEDRFRDRLKVAGINFYLDTLHTPRVADMADQFKDYKGVQAKLIRSTGEAETEAVSTSMQRGLDFLDFLQKEGIEVIPEESESDIRMNIVMRYREGARTQAETLMKHYNIAELPTLTEQEEKIIGYIQKDMEANKGKLAAAWEEVENEIFPEQEVYYLPLKYAKEEEIIPDVQTEGRGRTTHTFDGFSHARRPGVKKLPRVGVLQLYQEAVLEQEWYTQIQPVIADIKSVVLTDDYKESAGEVLYNWWKDHLDILSRRGWSASAQLNTLSSLMRAVRHNVNTAILAFKASTVLMQPFAVFDGMSYVNAHYGTRAAGKVLTEVTKSFLIPGTTKEIVERSDALQQRQGGELAITEEMKRAKGEGIKDKLTRLGFRIISQADVKTAAGTQEAIKKILMDEGVNETEAQKEAEFVMHMTQGSSSIAYRPHILARGEGARTWFTFQTFIMNRWGIIAHDLVAGNIVKGEFTKKMSGLISIGILMLAGYSEDEARKWLYNATHKKDIKDDKRSLAEIVLVDLASTMPFFGNIISAASENRDAYPPAMKTLVTGGQGVGQAVKGKTAESKAKGVMKVIETVLTLALGYPGTAQFFDLLEGALIKEKPKRR